MEPLFTCLAQVYNLDKVQKTWTPMTDAVIPVQFFAGDENRIKAVDTVKGLIFDTAIQPNTAFKKSGEAFVQWYDPTVKQMYGLNLKSKSDSAKIEQFVEEGKGKANKGNAPKIVPSSADNTKTKVPAPNTVEDIPRNAPSSNNANFNDFQPVEPHVAPKTGASEKLLNYVANLESQMKDMNVDDQHYVGVLETRIKHLEEKIELLEQTNTDLKSQISKAQDTSSKQIALMTKDNDLLKAALQQSNFALEGQKKQLHTIQEINSKLSEKLTAVSKIYDTFGELLSKS